MWGFGEAYVPPFAIFLKAGPTIMALLGTLPGLLGACGQIAGAILMERIGRRRFLLVVMTFIQGLSFAPLFLLPLLFPAVGALWVLVVYCGATLLFSGCAPLWNSLMGDVVPENERGRYFGRRARTVIAGMVVFMLLASVLMSRFKAWNLPWTGFGLLFLVALLARCVSGWLLHQHVDPPPDTRVHPPLHAPGWWTRLRRSPYAYFLLVQTLLGGAFAIAAPFFGLYMLRDLGWTYTQFTAMTVVFLLAQISVVRWWGVLSDRHGNRVVYQSACLLLPLPYFAWFLTTDFTALLLAQCLNGALSAGCNLAAANYVFDTVPPVHRARVISYQSLVGALVNLGAGLLGAGLARHLPSALHFGGATLTLASTLPLIFLLAGLLRLLLGAWLLPRMREVRSIEPISSMEILRRFATAEPLLEPMGRLASRFSQIRRAPGARPSIDTAARPPSARAAPPPPPGPESPPPGSTPDRDSPG